MTVQSSSNQSYVFLEEALGYYNMRPWNTGLTSLSQSQTYPIAQFLEVPSRQRSENEVDI